nr:DUF1638 domain-containing protein [Rhodoligotrophos appendicifer]
MNLETVETFGFRRGEGRLLLIACGALATEIVTLIEANQWAMFDLACLPAKLHNHPEMIPEAVREKIREARGAYENIFVLYGDCGTGGLLDRVVEEEGVERIPGPHCYSFFTGNDLFAGREDADFRSFYLTDYLARHFDKLVWEGLGLDRHPELLPLYFGNYEKVIYLAQVNDPGLDARAETAAKRLGLGYERRFTGYGDMDGFLRARTSG